MKPFFIALCLLLCTAWCGANAQNLIPVMSKEGRWGYCRPNGELAIPFRYLACTPFDGAYALVGTDTISEAGLKGAIMDTLGNIVLDGDERLDWYFKYNDDDRPYGQPLAPGVAAKSLMQVKATEIETTFALPTQYNSRFTILSEGLIPVTKKSDGWGNEKWGYIDSLGREVIPCQFDAAGQFYGGLAAVYKSGPGWGNKNDSIDTSGKAEWGWGFIDTSGRLVIPHQYAEVEQFNEELAAVKRDSLWGFIDKMGKEVIPFQYKSYWGNRLTDGFSCGLAIVNIEHRVTGGMREPKLAIIDTLGNKKDFLQEDERAYIIYRNGLLQFKSGFLLVMPKADLNGHSPTMQGFFIDTNGKRYAWENVILPKD